MLKIKVIADNILNLTDARYFAAYGVDYLVFNLDNITPAAISAMKEWVEGVNILLETNGSLTSQVLEFIVVLAPEGIVSLDEELLNEIQPRIPDGVFFLRKENGELQNINHQDEKPYVKIDSSTKDLETLVSSDNISGIIVEGEPEEKVGFKNFDQLDEIFDLIAS